MRAPGAHVEMNESTDKLVGGLTVERIAALLSGHERNRLRSYRPNENRKDGKIHVCVSTTCIAHSDAIMRKICAKRPAMRISRIPHENGRISKQDRGLQWFLSTCRVPALSLRRIGRRDASICEPRRSSGRDPSSGERGAWKNMRISAYTGWLMRFSARGIESR